MFKSRIPKWTRLKCYRRYFHFLEFCPKECSLPRNDFVHKNLNHIRHIWCTPKMKNFNRLIRKHSNTETTKPALSFTDMKQLLKKCESVAMQIEVFNSQVKLSEEDVSNRQAACQEVDKVFKSHFPESSLQLIGSSVTGFGLKGCDVDLSFQFHTEECNSNTSRISEDAVLSNDIEAGIIPTTVIPALLPKQQLRFLRKVLIDSGIGGSSPTIIPGRCPILNFTHRSIQCDMSVNNKSALGGTNLMLLCGKLDKRVAPLFRVLTYWGKHSKLIGGPMKFKCYALFLLLVYFLQTRQPPILPPIQKMLDKTEFGKNQDNWSYDVCAYLGNFEVSRNSQSSEELLEEFFLFYSNFDFSTVISPMTSDLIDMNLFLNQDVPEDCKFELNSISIQDPLNLDWNVTTSVNWKYCRSLIKGLLSASIAIQENYYTPSSDKNWGLLSLLDYQNMSDCLLKRNCVTIEVPLVLATYMRPEIQEQYLNSAAENVYKVFEYCLNFQCKSVNAPMHNQNIKVGSEKDLQIAEGENSFQQHSSPFVISCFMSTSSDTWFGRSNFQSQSFNENVSNFLETERNISEKLYRDKRGKNKEKDLCFRCKCVGAYEQDRVKLLVNLEAVDSDLFSPKLIIFLKNYIPKCVIKLLSST